MCLQSLERTDVIEIGRLLLASDLEPFLKISTTSALCHVICYHLGHWLRF